MSRYEEMIRTPVVPPGVLNVGPYNDDYVAAGSNSFGVSAEEVANDPDGRYEYDSYSGRYIKQYESTPVDHGAVGRHLAAKAQEALSYFAGRSVHGDLSEGTRGLPGSSVWDMDAISLNSSEMVQPTEWQERVARALGSASLIDKSNIVGHMLERPMGGKAKLRDEDLDSFLGKFFTLGEPQNGEKPNLIIESILSQLETKIPMAEEDSIVRAEEADFDYGNGRIPKHLLERSKKAKRGALEARVPEHLLQRSRDRRAALGIHKLEDSHLDDISVEVGALIDLDSAVACDFSAVAVRRKLRESLNLLVGDFELPKTFNELVWDGRQFVAQAYSSQERPRFVKDIGSNLHLWVDLETEKQKKWLRKERTLIKRDPEDVEALVYTVGTRVEDVYVPIFKSIETSNGCHVIFPDGSEIEDGEYNRQQILHLASRLVVDGEPVFGELITELCGTKRPHANEGQPDPRFELLRRLISGEAKNQLNPLDNTLIQLIGSYKKRRVDVSEVRVKTDPDATSTDKLQVIASKPGWMDIKIKGKSEKGKLRMAVMGGVVPSTNLATYNLDIYIGLDEQRYGLDKAIAYRRFAFVTDLINPPNLFVLDASGTPRKASDDERKNFELLVDELEYTEISYNNGFASKQRPKKLPKY